jgi:hypothetical protein
MCVRAWAAPSLGRSSAPAGPWPGLALQAGVLQAYRKARDPPYARRSRRLTCAQAPSVFKTSEERVDGNPGCRRLSIYWTTLMKCDLPQRGRTQTGSLGFT